MKTILAALAALLPVVASAEAPVVRAPAGAVSGATENNVRVFRGIPYPRPPVGSLRWSPPVAFAPWAGVRAATAFGAACVQPVIPVGIYANAPDRMSEDCLTLNVWTPRTAAKAPVIVWIHGGSLVAGYGHEAMYDGAKWAARGAVVVSINYRLGVFGYLAHPELSAEQGGVSGGCRSRRPDRGAGLGAGQHRRLRGRSRHSTVAGESASRLSVLYLMASPAAKGLFGKAIAQSSYMVSTPELKAARHGMPSAEDTGARIAREVGAGDLKGLRAMEPQALMRAAAAKGFVPWGTVDGKLLPRQLVDTWDRGEQAKVPLLAGFNAGEIRSLRMLLPPGPPTPPHTRRRSGRATSTSPIRSCGSIRRAM
ncbi:carboxylesterase family protein [Sphingomonas sp. MMS24-JH45]